MPERPRLLFVFLPEFFEEFAGRFFVQRVSVFSTGPS
jgi:hypothetical protein